MKQLFCLILAGLITAASTCADPAAPTAPADPMAEMLRVRKLIQELKPQQGEITLNDGIAKVTVPQDLRFLDAKDTETVLCDLWHNPRSQNFLGMLVPVGFNPARGGSWATIITYQADGYVKDDDAASLNYDKLMTEMKEGAAEENKTRVQQGYPSIELVGWAEPPRYDPATHKMYWAKDIRFNGQQPDTLNYNIRMLGRRGVLVLNVVAGMSELAQVRSATPEILRTVNFQQGNRYADFNSSTDKLATYGLAALVVGGIAAKAGLFKVILIALLAAKKFIILGAAAIAAYFKKLFKKKKNQFTDPALSPPAPPSNPN